MNDKEKHIETIAKMYAEQILANSIQIADQIVKSAIEHAGNISNNADKMSKVISIEAMAPKKEMKMTDDWQNRVIDERAELLKKYLKLKDFINYNSEFHSIQMEEQNLLKEQLKIMADYLNILKKRVERF